MKCKHKHCSVSHELQHATKQQVTIASFCFKTFQSVLNLLRNIYADSNLVRWKHSFKFFLLSVTMLIICRLILGLHKWMFSNLNWDCRVDMQICWRLFIWNWRWVLHRSNYWWVGRFFAFYSRNDIKLSTKWPQNKS